MSHYGNIEHDTQEGRLYSVLKSNPGQWFDGLYLSQQVRTIALHTCVHGTRQQLPAGERIENKIMYRAVLKRKGSYYRLVVA